MFSTIIAGVDTVAASDDALALARRLAEPEAAIIAVTVAVADRRTNRRTHLDYDRDARDAARDAVARAAADDPALEPAVVVAPSPAAGLHEIAEARGADLVVVGSSRRGVIGRILAGDDTRAVLHDAPCAIAVAPAGYARRAGAIDAVGIGYDGSLEGEAALAFGCAIGEDLGIVPDVVQAYPYPDWSVSAGMTIAEAMEAEAEAAREHLARIPGVRATLRRGLAAEQLTELSAHVDLLVLGARHHGALGRVFMGSVADRLARHSHCPLLIVPRAGRPAAAPAG